MIEVPEPIRAICREMAAKYGDDIAKAVRETEGLARQLPEFLSFVDQLVSYAIRDVVYQERHLSSRRIKKESGAYHTAPKAPHFTPKMLSIVESVYDYKIGGMTLGSLTRNEISDLIGGENDIIEGHRFRVRLLEKIRPLLADDRPVREQIPEKDLRSIFRDAKRKAKRAA